MNFLPILLVGLLIVSADAIRMSADSLIVLTNTIRKNAHRKGIFFALSIERAVSSHSQRRKIRIVLTKNKKKRPAGSRRCSMTGRYAWYLH